MTESLARRALDRSAAARHAEYVRDVQRIVDATYRLIERTGGIDPSLREVLAEAGLSTQAFYRFFRSKDELMLVILDDGRRQLLGYLEHRMARATSPADKVRAWIEGVLAQASNPEAAARTRPFLVNQDRLVEAFPEEQQASVDLLVGLLVNSLEELRTVGPGPVARRGPETARRDAEAVYRLALATLHDHLVGGTTPSGDDVDHLVAFVLRGVGATASAGTPSAARLRRHNAGP
jgi:AcrR family transcriptional regulator